MPEERDLTPTEYAVLGLLAAEPQHGYELARRWQRSPLADVSACEQSVLYAHLRTLGRRGLIDWEEIRVGNRPPRRIFSASEGGRTVLRAWLRAPATRMRAVRLDLLLKIYILRLIDPDAEPRLVARQVEACRRYLDEMHRRLERAEGFERLVWESKATAAQATLTWLSTLRPGGRRGRRAAS